MSVSLSYRPNAGGAAAAATMANNRERDRAALFGGASGGNGAQGRDSGMSVAEQSRSLMEESNDRAIAELQSKVAHMRGIAFDIEAAIQEDKKVVDSLGGSFERVTAMMRGTVSSVQKMLETGGSRHMAMLIGFILAVFFVLYWLMK